MRRISFILLAVLVVAGCGGGKSAYVVRQYLPDYAPPAGADSSRIDEAIRVEPFATAQAYNSTAMFYRPSPFELSDYSRERWRVPPGDMVTDYLLRDLRHSGGFRAVLGYDDGGEGRYGLNGTIVEFLEVDGNGGPGARLAVDATLLDNSQREITKRVVFQKTYAVEEAMKDKSARAMAEAMSRALKKFSGELAADIRRAAGAGSAVRDGEEGKTLRR